MLMFLPRNSVRTCRVFANDKPLIFKRSFTSSSSSPSSSSSVRHIRTISDLSGDEIRLVINEAIKIKKSPGKYSNALKDKTLLSLFEKPSLRTRVSFEVGMTQLGGHSIFYSMADSPLGKKETFGDTGACLSRYCDVISARLNSRVDINELSNASTIPVINALDDWAHPCQMLADFMTIQEKKGDLLSNASNIKICYLGDCRNNVTYDLMRCSSLLGIQMSVCGPALAPDNFDFDFDFDFDFAVEQDVIDECQRLNGNIEITDNYEEALQNCEVVYTDSWMSYHIAESQQKERVNILGKYRVTDEKMKLAKQNAIFMNCLPAIRGMEQTAQVIDGDQSVVFDQAENRLHAQKSLLIWLVNGDFEPRNN